jgi:hypothetical protein
MDHGTGGARDRRNDSEGMSIAVIGGGIRQRPGVRKAQPHSPCCKNELLTSDSKAPCLGGVSDSELAKS